MKKILLTLIVSVAFYGSIFAQSNPNGYESHWNDTQLNWFKNVDYPCFFVKIDDNIVNFDDRWYDYEFASFVGDECRGHCFMTPDYLEYGWTYPLLEGLMVKFDNSGEEVTFKMFDHANGIEYDFGVTNVPVFTDETHFENWFFGPEDFDMEDWEEYALILSFTSPETPAFTQQTIELSEGWNWVSIYVEGDPGELLDLLKAGLGENATEIQSLDYMIEYDGEEWEGDLNDEGLANDQMYLINAVDDCTVTLEGLPAVADNYEITIYPGWNWIGFPNAEPIEVSVALADFEAEEGDEIQSLDYMTEYDGEDWEGDLETFEPGQGLLYYSNSDETKTLVFSTGAKGKRVPVIKKRQ